MSSLEDTLDTMEARARAFGAKVLVVDVRGGATRHDPELQRRRDMLAVSVVLSMPSDADSRYRVEEVGRFLADTPEAGRAGMNRAGQLAERLGATLHPASAEPPTADARSWLALQGPSPARPWVIAWSTTVWRPDGTVARDQGERAVEAESGSKAHYAASRQVVRNLAPPFKYTITCKELGRPDGGTYHMAPYPVALPAKDALRKLARAGRPPSAILTAPLKPVERRILRGETTRRRLWA